IPRSVPVRLTSRTCCHFARSNVLSGPKLMIPALLTKTFSAPNSPTATLTAAAHCSGLVTSRCTKCAAAPSSSANAVPSSSRMSPITTLAPSATNSRACDAPMPLAPPLISATFPSTRPMTGQVIGCCSTSGVEVVCVVAAVFMVLTACSGFLLAVLWMDLIFDSQVVPHRNSPGPLPEPVLESIAAYYHRATTTSRPMSRLIALVMVILLGALGFHATRGQDPGWLMLMSAGLAGVPTMLALTQTVSDAVRLGHRTDSVPEQSRLARSVCR